MTIQKKWNKSVKAKLIRYNKAIILILCLIICGFFLIFSWNKYKEEATSEALTMAKSLEALIRPQNIEKLYGVPEEIKKPEYIISKSQLNTLVAENDDIETAYLLGMRDGRIVFLTGSESYDSHDYSPPGQPYGKGIKAISDSLKTGKTFFVGPVTDRWGKWYKVFVPVMDHEKGQAVAVLGLDYSASKWQIGLWKQMIPDFFIVLFFMFFVYELFRAGVHYFKLKALSDKTALNEELYHSIFQQVPIGIAIVNDKQFVSQSDFGNENMNPMFEKILGRTQEELACTEWMDITHPDDLQSDLEEFEKFKSGKTEGYSIQKRFLKPDGSYVWTYMKISHFLGKLWDNPMHLCILEDISAEKNALETLRESDRSKSVLISNIPGMAYRCKFNYDRTMQFVSAGCYKLTGHAAESLLDNKDLRFDDIISPEYRDIVRDEWECAVKAEKQFKLEYEIRTARGETKWVIEIGKGIYNEKNEVETLEGIILDISERKKIENKLIFVNQHDIYTGLYNRSYLDNLLIKDQMEQSESKMAFICINLSSAQSLSKLYGFNYAQDIIKNIAEILNQFSTKKRILVKAFEYCFIYYVKDYRDKNELMVFSRKIADSFEPILLADRIQAGVGVFEINPEEELDLNKLSKEVLIFSEKAIDANDSVIGIRYYDSKMEEAIKRDEDIKLELNYIAAHEADESFYMQYQPIFDLKANKVCGFEALARLKTEKLGQVAPIEFIPIAEKTKLIIPIGWNIFRKAFKFLSRLNTLCYEDIYIAINVSAIQIMKNDFLYHLFNMVKVMQVDPKYVNIEITESVFASDYNLINRRIGFLREHGFSVAIDDFGTEYSSLSRERELSIDCIKIDKYFIDKLMEIRHENTITSDIVSMAHKLGHSTVAEGVEYEEQKQYLINCGCDKIQGYLVGKPMDEDDAIDFIKKNRGIK